MDKVFRFAVVFFLLGLLTGATASAGPVVTEPAVHRSDGAGFFAAPVPIPDDAPRGPLLLTCRTEAGDLFLVHASLPAAAGRAGGQNAFWGEDGEPRAIVTGRYRTGGPAKVVILRPGSNGGNRPLLTVEFELPDGAHDAPDVMRTWAEHQRRSFQLAAAAGTDPFLDYWDLVAAPRYGLPASARRPRERPRQPAPDLFSIFSGGAAVQESLQLEVLMGRQPAPTAQVGQNTVSVPISTLQGPTVRSHPFDEMLAGRAPKLSPLNRFIPEDQYAVLFADINQQIELSDLIEEWGGNLLREIESNSRDYRVNEKIERQLCLEAGLVARLFGDQVVGEMAFTGRDPFFKEGTDFTVLFELRKKSPFLRHLERRYGEAVRRGARRREEFVGEHNIMSVTTPDGTVSSYTVLFGDVAAVSTSRSALLRVIASAEGRLSALADAPDFRYMRTIFPRSDAREDVFVYLSDAHIRRLVGPQWKIGETRRLRCAGNLHVLSNASLWYRIERGVEPNLETMEQGGYLGPHPLVCPDGGRYTVAGPQGSPTCSVHNRMGYLTPVGDLPLDAATETEAEAYKGFVANYNRYWRQFFDPIGVRIKLGKSLRVETCVLPLIENSWYDGLVAFAGREPGELSESSRLPRTVASFRARVSPEWDGRHRLFRHTPGRVAPHWLGNEISLNLCDGQVLFTLAEGMGGRLLGLRGWGSPVGSLAASYLISALNLPTYLSLAVTDAAEAKQALPGLFRTLIPPVSSRTRPVETYPVETHRGELVYVNTFDLFAVKLRLYTAVVGDRLIIASRRDVVTDLLNLQAEGGLSPAARKGSMEISAYRSAFRELEPTVALGYGERLRHVCHANLALAEVLLSGTDVRPDGLSPVVFDLRGYEPYCPSGGGYALDPATGQASCSVHGTVASPRQPRKHDDTSPTMQLVNSLDAVNLRLAFTPEGLRAVVEVDRK